MRRFSFVFLMITYGISPFIIPLLFFVLNNPTNFLKAIDWFPNINMWYLVFAFGFIFDGKTMLIIEICTLAIYALIVIGLILGRYKHRGFIYFPIVIMIMDVISSIILKKYVSLIISIACIVFAYNSAKPSGKQKLVTISQITRI